MHQDGAEQRSSGSAEAARQVRTVVRRAQRARRFGLHGLVAARAQEELTAGRVQYRDARAREVAAGAPLRVAVSGWSLSQNAAGRAMTLVQAYQRVTPEVEIIGWLITRWGRQVWEPIRETNVAHHAITLFRGWNFLPKALRFVAEHPYDVVHLSKPRLHNVVLGRLYELVWGARVIIDVDDEELGFVGGGKSLSLHEALAEESGRLPRPRVPHSPFWTRVGVGQITTFAQVTVSNPALQRRYGGELLPHVRDEFSFVPSEHRRSSARSRWNIPESVTVVLFFGTPRRHKGLLETARALAQMSGADVWFVIAGEFPADEATLKHDLQAVQGLTCRFIGAQPYGSVPDVVAMADCVILLQEEQSLVAKYQLPAKMIDALAMGLPVLGTVTAATEWLAEAGVLIPASVQDIPEVLSEQMQNAPQLSAVVRKYFLEHLSVGAVQPIIHQLLEEPLPDPRPWHGQLKPLLAGEIQHLLRA